jgi:hypothetical protein
MFKEMTDERKNFLYLTIFIDYLKVNGYRIASHSAQKTPTPLSSRADIEPLLPLVKDATLDILGLDNESKITLCKTFYNDDLQAHGNSDENVINSIKSILKSNLTNCHFIFLTNGILMPDLVAMKDWEQLLGISKEELSKKIFKIEFFETRVSIEMLSKLSDQKVYLKNIISKMKKINPEFKESDFVYEGEKCLEGSYNIQFHGKSQTYPYWISETGIQLEAPTNGEKIGEFVSSFR